MDEVGGLFKSSLRIPLSLRRRCSGCGSWDGLPLSISEKLSSLSLCPACSCQLWSLRKPQGDETPWMDGSSYAIYTYDRLIKSLIWRAKIHADDRALLLLCQIGATARAQALVTWADTLVVAPSSLWSRLRGRLDIAALWGQALGIQYRRPVLPAPGHLYWRPGKRARQKGAQRQKDMLILPVPLQSWTMAQWVRRLATHGSKRILLIDDIITTGATMNLLRDTVRIAGHDLGRHLQISAMALARSGAHEGWPPERERL